MKYTEEKALRFKSEFNLPASTVRVWKSRNVIPDKYSRELPKKITSTHELQQITNLINAFKTEKFKIASLCRLAGLPNTYSLHDTLNEKSMLSKQELIALKKAINIIRNDTKKVLQSLGEKETIPESTIKDIRKLLQRNEVAWFVVLDRNRKEWSKFESWKNERVSNFPLTSIPFFKSCLLVFLMETTI
jgi:hypothetical protein